MPAALAKNPLNTTPLNSYGVLVTYEIAAAGAHRRRMAVETTAPGAHRRWQAVAITAPGQHNNTVAPYRVLGHGVRRQLAAFAQDAPGRHNAAVVNVTLAAPGAAHLRAAYTAEVPGMAAHYNEVVAEAPGAARMLIDFEVTAPGMAVYGMGHIVTAPGAHNIAQPKHTRVYRQGYRVEDAAMARWELYVGVGEMPDFDDMAQPVATGTTSPVTWSPPLPGAGLTHTLYVVVRRRNSLGLMDHNQHPILIEIDENGDEVLGPLTAPELSGVLDGATSGSLQAWGQYPSGGDRNPADTWELYAVLGVDPVPGADPVLQTAAMGVAGGGNTTRRMSAMGLTPGAVYHVRLAVRRAADGARAASAVVPITLIPVYGVAAEDAAMFGGEEYEINQ